MRNFILFIFLCGPFALHAQLLDSIGLFLKEEPRIVAKLDMRGSFVSTRNVRIAGVKVGFDHGKRFQYGIGYSFLLTPIIRLREVPGQGLVETRLRVGYITPYVDYAFYQRKRVQVRIPVQIGIGSGSIIYRDPEERKRKLLRTGLFIYEPAMTVHYRFLKYFEVGGGIGYRLAIHTRQGLDEQITAPIYMLGLRVLFGDLWKAINSSAPDQSYN